MKGESPEASTVCWDCRVPIECCEVCGDEPCPQAVRLGCLRLAVGQSVPEPHIHSG